MSLFSLSNPPRVYALMGAPFGDLEFDIGKSARWMEYFSDDMFVLDVNLGTQRYWIVNWSITFPNAEHEVTGINYFTDPVAFRQEQFRLANNQYHFDNEDWILWIDGSEGLSFDTRSLPDDYNSDPFMSFVWREIERAEASAVKDKVVLPFYAFLRNEAITNVSYDHPQNPSGIISGNTSLLTFSFDSTGLVFSGAWTNHASPVTWSFALGQVQPVVTTGFNVVQPMPPGVWSLVVNQGSNAYLYSVRVSETIDGVPIPILQQPVSVPYYLPSNGLTRLTKVSRLRNDPTTFAAIDVLSAPSANVKAQVISYAYAHWSEHNIPPGQTEVPPLSEENDDGFRMRKLISLVRPLPGLPFLEQPPYSPTNSMLWLTAADFTDTAWPSGGATPIVMTQADQTKRPSLVTGFANGMPAVRFASKDCMFTTNALLNMPGDWMVACVVATRPSNNEGMVWMFGRELTLQRRAFWASGSTGRIAFSGYDSNVMSTALTDVPTLVTITRRSGLIAIYANGSVVASGSPTLSAFTYNGFAIGANVSGTEGWSGDMGDLIVDTADLATQQRTEGFLAWRYGLQGSLPPSHPFVAGPPSSSGDTPVWDPVHDATGQSGPWAVSTIINTHPDLVATIDGAPSSTPALPQLGIPLYDTVLRLNLRDGVWYEGDVSGNTPLMWDEATQKWVPPYDPDTWPAKGVEAPQTEFAP